MLFYFGCFRTFSRPLECFKKICFIIKSDGIIIISIPNIRNFSILKKLFFKGRWDYEESGILDRLI